MGKFNQECVIGDKNLLQMFKILGILLGIIGGQTYRFVFLLKIGGAKIMPKKKTVKELDSEIERLKRQVEIEDLKGKLATKKRGKR